MQYRKADPCVQALSKEQCAMASCNGTWRRVLHVHTLGYRPRNISRTCGAHVPNVQRFEATRRRRARFAEEEGAHRRRPARTRDFNWNGAQDFELKRRQHSRPLVVVAHYSPELRVNYTNGIGLHIACQKMCSSRIVCCEEFKAKFIKGWHCSDWEIPYFFRFFSPNYWLLPKAAFF